MSLTLATLIPGIVLLVLGTSLLLGNSAIVATYKAFPRSRRASYILFGLGAAWFLWEVAHLSEADFGEYRSGLFIGFFAVAALSFFYAPDFLAVRGACVLMLMAALPLLGAGYMIYEPAQIYLYKIAVYAGIVLALYLGAAPYRLRDFFQWLFARPSRSRWLGTALALYGAVLGAVAFTY